MVWNNLSKAYQQQALTTRSIAIAAEEEEVSASELWQQVRRDRTLAEQAAQKAIEIGANSQSLAQAEALIQRVKLAADFPKKSFDTTPYLQKAAATEREFARFLSSSLCSNRPR